VGCYSEPNGTKQELGTKQNKTGTKRNREDWGRLESELIGMDLFSLFSLSYTVPLKFVICLVLPASHYIFTKEGLDVPLVFREAGALTVGRVG
jgi:hypothetical protein